MITFVPAGGLGNRMKAIAAAIRLAQDVKQPLQIVWFQDWGLGCRYDDLFEPLEMADVTLKEASFLDLLTRDVPRRRNLWIPRMYERLHYDAAMDWKTAATAFQEGFDFVAWARGRDVWLSSCHYFMSEDIPDDAFAVFTPTAPLLERIRQTADTFEPGIIGVHIRRTDNESAIRQSPTSLFIERMRQEPADRQFYLATDSEDVKRQLRDQFGKRILTAPFKAERGNRAGMENALVEMYLLASTSRIIGTAASTYSMTAATIGGIPIEILSLSAADSH